MYRENIRISKFTYLQNRLICLYISLNHHSVDHIFVSSIRRSNNKRDILSMIIESDIDITILLFIMYTSNELPDTNSVSREWSTNSVSRLYILNNHLQKLYNLILCITMSKSFDIHICQDKYAIIMRQAKLGLLLEPLFSNLTLHVN